LGENEEKQLHCLFGMIAVGLSVSNGASSASKERQHVNPAAVTLEGQVEVAKPRG